MRMAYYPSDFLGHDLRYSCTKCQRKCGHKGARSMARHLSR